VKGFNGEQMSVHHRFKIICKNIMFDWNKNHKEQVHEQNQELTLQRLSLTLAKYLEQPEVYNILVNAQINLKEN
jgi:hypothetical protein